MMEKTRTDGFCLFCSKADLNSNDFGCGEPIGLCGTCDILILCKFIVLFHPLILFLNDQTAKKVLFVYTCDVPV